MQMLGDAKLPRVDKNHNKHGDSLADLEKQLWVGNSEQTELSTAAARVNPPVSLEGSHSDQICVHLEKYCQESKLSTGKEMSGLASEPN